MGAFDIVSRKGVIRLAKPKEYIRQRIAESADSLNRAGQAAARVELCNEALHKLIEFAYAQDVDGIKANVDACTNRLLIPAPWGSVGRTKWGLSRYEADMMRMILMRRCTEFKPSDRPPLIVYDAHSNSWSINMIDYPTMEAAAFWLRHGRITLREWRDIMQQTMQEPSQNHADVHA